MTSGGTLPVPRATAGSRGRFLVAALAAALLAPAGCGGPPRAIVRGTVRLDGEPLAAGLVVFEGGGRSYGGTIGPDGRYELRHLGKPEVLPGTYGVAVLPPESRVVADPKTTNLEVVEPVDQRRYPERFRLAATSGITRTVAAGEATLDIDLTSQ